MTPYWIRFKNQKPGCVEAENEQEARKLASEITGSEVENIDRIPYPADPRLNTYEYLFGDGKKSVCPSFCYTPMQCLGRGSCPKSYACSE